MTNGNKTKTLADTYNFIKMVAEKQDWNINPDREFVDIIVKGLNKNYNRYGYYSCPCREAEGVKEKDSEIICPCRYCKPDQDEYGHCYCLLYLIPDFFKTGKHPQCIPDRRLL